MLEHSGSEVLSSQPERSHSRLHVNSMKYLAYVSPKYTYSKLFPILRSFNFHDSDFAPLLPSQKPLAYNAA